jgi:sulfur-carrier protein
MQVELKLFAALREDLGVASETLEVPGEVKTVADVRHYLGLRSPEWLAALSSPRIRVAVNRRLAKDATELTDACELAFFPPVTGG